MDLLIPKFGNTLILAGASFFLAVVGGVTVGLLAAARPQTAVDRTAMGVSLVVGNMPPFWLGLVLIVFFAINLRWLPSLGMYSSRGPGGLGDLLLHLIMPAVATAAAPGAIIARMTCACYWRSSARTTSRSRAPRGSPSGRCCGCTPSGLRGRPSSPSPACSSATCWAARSSPRKCSAGRASASSSSPVIARDVQVVQGAALFIAVMFVLVNLVVDLLNLYLDPRARPA